MKRTILSVILAIASIASATPSAMTNAPVAPVCVNSGSVSNLMTLPGIGPVLAARIVAGRPYSSPADLIRVRGIGMKKLAAITNLVITDSGK